MPKFSIRYEENRLINLRNIDQRNEDFLREHELAEGRAKNVSATAENATKRIGQVQLKKSGALNLWADAKALAQKNANVLDKEVTAVARDRAKQATDKIADAASAAETKLFGKKADAKGSLALVEWKVRVCDDALSGLKAELDNLQKVRQAVAPTVKAARKIPKATAEELKQLTVTMEHLQTVRDRAQAQAEARMSADKVSRALSVRDNLRTMLLDFNPSLAARIDKLIIDHAAGTNKELAKCIEELLAGKSGAAAPVDSPQIKLISEEDRGLLKSLAKQLTKNGKATAEVLKAQASTSTEFNQDGEPVKNRLKRSFEKANPGQGLVLTAEGRKLQFGVLSKDSGEGGRILLAAPNGEKATIDVEHQMLTFHHSPSFIHYDLGTHKLASTEDPTKIHLDGRIRARSIAPTIALAA
jgi:hypothetical protein